MHLRYCLMTAEMDCGERRHPQEVMRALGITYQHSTPQSLGNQWWFWNCRSMPALLPAYLTELKVDPMDAIGYGLSRKMAEAISAASQPTAE